MKSSDFYGQTVFLFLQGPSLNNLIDNKEKVEFGKAICGVINRPSVVEKRLDRLCDFIYLSSKERYSQENHYLKLRTFHGTLTITNHEFSHLGYLTEGGLGMCKYEKVLSSFGYGFSSLTACLLFLMRENVKRIYLFGADGAVSVDESGSNKVYFDHHEYEGENFSARSQSIFKDTKMMNKTFWDLVDYWSIPRADIINVCETSKIECFNKMSFDQFLGRQSYGCI